MDEKGDNNNFSDTDNLLECGGLSMPKLSICQLCEEEVLLDAMAICLRCEKKWCDHCAQSWHMKCTENEVEASCPYCRSIEVSYPFVITTDSDEDKDSSCNEAIKGIFVLITYSLLLLCVIVYFYDISNIDTSDDFMYFVMYILFLAYIMACLGLASRSLLQCCRR